MPLTRNKQLAMYFLLSTRSNYRARLEGIPVVGSGAPQNPPTSATDLVSRFASVPAPSGFTSTDIAALTDSLAKTDRLFVDPNVHSGPQSNNVSTDPVVVAYSLGLFYDITNPDCPSTGEGNLVSAFLANLP